MGMKESYQDKMEAQLKEWQAKIDLFKARADKAEAEQKIKYYKKIESLRGKQQQVHHKLDELRSASGDAWEEVKSGVETAWKDLKDSVDSASEKFK